MEFIETPTFTRIVTELLSDDEYRELQNILVEDPGRGNLVKGEGQSPDFHVGGLSKIHQRQFD